MGASNASIPLAQRPDRRGNGRIRFTDVTFLDENGNMVSNATSGKPLTVLLSYKEANGQKARDVDAFITFHGSYGELLFVCHVRLGRGTYDELPPVGQLVCRIPRFPLTPGRYHFGIEIGIAPAFLMDSIDDAGSLFVEPGDFYGTGNLPMRSHQSAVMVEHEWDLIDLSG
jgi:hypothetical protein